MKTSNMITISKIQKRWYYIYIKKVICHKGSEVYALMHIFTNKQEKAMRKWNTLKSSTLPCSKAWSTFFCCCQEYYSCDVLKQQWKVYFPMLCTRVRIFFSSLFRNKSVKRIELKTSYIKMTVDSHANWLRSHTLVCNWYDLTPLARFWWCLFVFQCLFYFLFYFSREQKQLALIQHIIVCLELHMIRNMCVTHVDDFIRHFFGKIFLTVCELFNWKGILRKKRSSEFNRFAFIQKCIIHSNAL